MQKKSIDKWVAQGRKNCKSFVFYEDKVLDLSDFILQHPGGIKAIKNYVYKDITNIIFQVYPHQKTSTLPRLLKYQVGLIPEQQATNARQKADKTSNIERPRQKKKVCFTSEYQRLMSSNGAANINVDDLKRSMNKSVKKGKQNIRESTHKSNASKQVNKSKSKSKNKQFLTSIRVINEDDKKSYEDYFNQNQQKIRQKSRANTEARKQKRQRPPPGSCSFVNNELDEEKPNFKVPVLLVKHMNRHL